MEEKLTMQQSGGIFPGGCKSLQVGMSWVGIPDPTSWSLERKEPGGNYSMREAGQVPRTVGAGRVLCETTVRIYCVGIHW